MDSYEKIMIQFCSRVTEPDTFLVINPVLVHYCLKEETEEFKQVFETQMDNHFFPIFEASTEKEEEKVKEVILPEMKKLAIQGWVALGHLRKDANEKYVEVPGTTLIFTEGLAKSQEIRPAPAGN